MHDDILVIPTLGSPRTEDFLKSLLRYHSGRSAAECDGGGAAPRVQGTH